jgi:hypothetical protein
MSAADKWRSAFAWLALTLALAAFAVEARGDEAAEDEPDAKLEHCLDQAEVGDREYDQRLLDDCMNDGHPQTWDARE